MHLAAAVWLRLGRNRSTNRFDVKYSLTERWESRISCVIVSPFLLSLRHFVESIVTRLEHSLVISLGTGILFLSSNPGLSSMRTARKSTASSTRSGLSDQARTCRIRIDCWRCLSGIRSSIRAYVSSSVGGRLASASASCE